MSKVEAIVINVGIIINVGNFGEGRAALLVPFSDHFISWLLMWITVLKYNC